MTDGLGTLIGGVIAIGLVENMIHHQRQRKSKRKTKRNDNWVDKELRWWD